MKRTIVALSLLAGAVVAASRFAGAEPIPEALGALLEGRAAAVRAHDKDAFLDTIDQAATGFREAQANWFDRVVALPLSDYSMKPTLDEEGEFTRKRDVDRYGAPTVVSGVEERYRIEGYDERPTLNLLVYSFVRRGPRWLVASDSDLDDLGLFSARQPWDFGPVEIKKSDHFLLVVHPEEARFAPELLRLAEDALADVDRAWLRPWSRRVPIFVPSTKRELERLLGATFDVGNFVAFAVSSADTSEGFEIVGSRIILNRTNFLRHSPSGRRAILAHELLHVATRGAAGPFISAWVEEGLAQLTESAGRPDTRFFRERVRAGKFDRRVPEDLEFLSGSGDDIFATYQEALSAMAYLVQRFGLERVGRFYEGYGSARVEPGTPRYHADRAMREVLGISFADLERDWAASVAGAG